MDQALPIWAQEQVTRFSNLAAREDRMRLALAIALQSALNGGGPFGAVVCTEDGELVSVGWNQVVSSHDSTAHAEVVAIRRAEAKLGTFSLYHPSPPFLELYTSAEPCIQCFGALWWASPRRVYAAASKADVESLGMEEGPVTEALWDEIRRAKGVELVRGFVSGPEALEPLAAYQRLGGRIYNR